VAAIFGDKLFGRSVLPDSAAPVVDTCVSRDAISLYVVDEFQWNLAQSSACECLSGHCWKGFKVKGQKSRSF